MIRKPIMFICITKRPLLCETQSRGRYVCNDYFVVVCPCVVLIDFLLRHFYAIFVWGYVEIYEIIKPTAFPKTACYQAFMGNYRILWRYENRSSSLDTKLHFIKNPFGYYSTRILYNNILKNTILIFKIWFTSGRCLLYYI